MPDEISMNTCVLFNQLEVTEQVTPAAWAAAQAVKVKAFTAVPLTGNRVERDFIKPYYGANPGGMAAKHGTMQFTAEAYGAGEAALDAGTAPAFGRLLRQAGCAELILAPADTIAASPPTEVDTPDGDFTYAAGDPYEGIVDRLVTLTCTLGGGSGVAEFTVSAPAVAHVAAYSVTGVVMTDATPLALPGGATITPTVGTDFTIGDAFTIQLLAPGSFYNPVSTSHESGSSFFQYGPNRHIFVGQRGNVQFNVTADAYFDLVFDFMGKPGARSSEAIPTVDFSAFRDGILVSDDNTPFASLGGVEIVLRSMSPNVGQNVVYRSLVGRSGAKITDRAMSGTMVFEALDVGDIDYFDNLDDSTVLPFRLIHGLARGEIVDLSMDRLELTGIQYQDEEGTAMFSVNWVALPSDAGNDEFLLGIK